MLGGGLWHISVSPSPLIGLNGSLNLGLGWGLGPELDNKSKGRKVSESYVMVGQFTCADPCCVC